MNILLYGATDTGYAIASRLHREHDVTLLDEQAGMPDRFEGLDIHFIGGSGTSVGQLEQAGGEKSDLFIACSDLDEANVVACWTMKKIADIETICFVKRADLYENLSSSLHSRYRTKYDIDTVLWPELLLTEEIFRIILVPDALDVEHFAEGKAKLFEYRIKEESVLRDQRIMDCSFPAGVLIVGITRDQQLFIPDGSTVIRQDDKVIFMGTGAALDQLAAKIFRAKSSIRSAAIIGGGSVGYMLAKSLEEIKIKVKIIEVDPERCAYLADNLNRSLVLQGDGSDIELLEEEAVGEMDVAVCVTNNDEKNLLCSLLVKQLGVERIITRAESARNSQLFERVGIDVVVSPRESAMTELRNRMRKEAVDILALVEGGQGEVLRVTVPESMDQTLIMDLNFPAKAIVAVIRRDRRVIVPDGRTLIRSGDRLKIFTMASDADAVRSFWAA